ncbi:MAG: transcriptional repressor [Proteobacteria bacterium]|nr:transcriptional repressor [Pseudomonadota bacterium]
MKLTAKRAQVLEGLVRSKKALSAYALTDYCRQELGYELWPMSVYRILEFLEENNLIHRLNTTNKYIACSHIICEHSHQAPQFLICKSCSKVEEVSIPKTVVASVGKAAGEAGFRLASKQLEIECYCSDCPTQEQSR